MTNKYYITDIKRIMRNLVPRTRTTIKNYENKNHQNRNHQNNNYTLVTRIELTKPLWFSANNMNIYNSPYIVSL